MDAALAIRTAREHAGLSKRELARRAATSPAAIVAYESGTRDPTVGTLARIVQATGAVGLIELEPGPARPDRAASARALVDVLGLADAIPLRPAARELPYPPFPRG
jgi:transcriptional regulator with XRE-family HTH domain